MTARPVTTSAVGYGAWPALTPDPTLAVAGRFVVRWKRNGVTLMVERQKEPAAEPTTEEGHNAHPVEPAEGAREPGEDADAPRPPHPDEPAEGER
jgi:hypothetical protein